MKETLMLPSSRLPAIPAWLAAPFRLLEPVGNRLLLIAFCGAFSFVFMCLFTPFNMNQWYNGGPVTVTGVFAVFSACGIAALSISQFGLMRLKGKKPLRHWQFLAWFMGESMLVAAVVNIVNVSLHDHLSFSWLEYWDTYKYGFGVLALPYSIALLWFQRGAPHIQPAMIPTLIVEEKVAEHLLIRDEYDKLALSLPPASLLMLKAEDNYVQVFYRNGQGIKKELVRSSLKKLEPQLAGFNITRAHRSYMVNMSNVLLFKKNAKGHYLMLEGLDDQPVPVSASYLPQFQQKFTPDS
ncbi:LytR/AlgR family response regulator transcription factor [Chitinophaga rhizosphaerae]|uniref:LytR/AlgR family response regulator transcription factor n=1 Tax=Chitinophaga rhizosphaerae TaxID=1864947 RepID=UPI000F812C85|nr:LytTR family DNA-binding domain-containing protein [Chitinophaga rhizosphaerae]